MSDATPPPPDPAATATPETQPPKRTSIWVWIAAVAILLVAAVGGSITAVGGIENFQNLMGPTMVEVRGKVNYNGKPLSAGFVQTYYERQGPGWLGGLSPLEPDGTFHLQTNGKPGVLSGKHRFVVTWMDNSFPPKSLLPQKYTDPETTPFVFQISRQGHKDLVLDLEGGQ